MAAFVRFLAVVGAALLAACDATETSTTPVGSGFDFYVLALSWSPSYCEAEGENANQQQCGAERPFGFIVHGLWPNFEKGYPEFCADNPSRVNGDIEDGLLDIMPSRGLIRHQWRKHGTCSGLSQDHYFDTVRSAHDRVRLPDMGTGDGSYRMTSPEEIRSSFLAANPGLEAEHIAVTCDRRRLREVRLCMTTELEYRSCPDVTRRACRRDSIVVPPTRGR